MKKLYSIIFIAFLCSGAKAQGFSMGDLVSLTGYTSAKFDHYVGKKGYRSQGYKAGDSLAYRFFDKKAKDLQPEKIILKCEKDDKATVAFQTTDEAEYRSLCAQLKGEGYVNADAEAQPALYQKGPITIKTVSKPEEDKTVYSFIVEKKTLPKVRDIMFAEDFLQLTSHEYVAAVYGEANVKKDIFYFSEKELNKCSVLYPNTNMQVIFIWKDEVNNRELDFIIIGGQLRAQSSLNYDRGVELNAWRTAKGIRSGMNLAELEEINGQPLNIYGWDTEQPGVVAEKNTGNLDFKNIKVVLNCMDCAEGKISKKNKIIKSSDLLEQERRVFVSSLVILAKEK